MGLGEALDTNPGSLKVMQGRNEQGMCHSAIAFAKQHNRRKIIPCASSIGPGAANMVTAWKCKIIRRILACLMVLTLIQGMLSIDNTVEAASGEVGLLDYAVQDYLSRYLIYFDTSEALPTTDC